MNYTLKINSPTTLHSFEEAEGFAEARDKAQEFVSDRMDAFGEDTEALRQYGWLDAENAVLDIPEQGGTVLLPDGWRITIEQES